MTCNPLIDQMSSIAIPLFKDSNLHVVTHPGEDACCLVVETCCLSHEISVKEIRDIILFRQQTSKVLLNSVDAQIHQCLSCLLKAQRQCHTKVLNV